MPAHTLRNSLAAVLAAGLLPLLAACGGSSGGTAADPVSAAPGGGAKTTTAADGAGQLTVPDGADDNTKNEYLVQNALAACMKKKGFTYTPHIAAAAPSSSESIDGEDYAAAKKSREKYGFGYYARVVYADDPKAPFARRVNGGKQMFAPDDDEKGFTAAQEMAYNIAFGGPSTQSSTGQKEDKLGGCDLEAQTKVYGPPLSAAAEKKQEAARTEQNRENGQALNGDPQLVQLAQQFATCLTGQGIPVSTTQPTGMASMVRLDISSKLPENFGQMSKEAALPLLTKDIGIALKDLECGKDFRAAYFPKEKANPYYKEDR